MCSPAVSRPSTTGSSASWLPNLQKAIWQRDEARNVSRAIQNCLGNYLHGPGGSNFTTVHPLTLQFLGPDQAHLQQKFDEQRRQGIMHAQAAVYPVLIPTLLVGCILKLQTSSGWREGDVLGTVLIVCPYIIAWFSRCVPGGASLKHWHVNHVLLFLVSLAGASIIDDHSGALWQGFISDRTQVVHEKRTGTVYSWVPCIVGLGYVGGYSVLWPAHPLIVSVVAFEHLLWYFLPIIAFEKGDVRMQLIPQMFATAAIDFFIILGRVRVEFTEKLLLANTELLDRKRDKDRKHRNVLEAFCRHAVEVHMWLGADANHVMEDGDTSGLRDIWPEENDRAGRGPLLFQDLLATEDDANRFRIAINTSWMPDASEQVQLVPCKLNMYDPGMMQSVQKHCDVFILRSGVDPGVASCQESKFLVALRVKAASPESPRQGLEEVMPSSPQLKALTAEKVLRCAAEHEADTGPFSIRRRSLPSAGYQESEAFGQSSCGSTSIQPHSAPAAVCIDKARSLECCLSGDCVPEDYLVHTSQTSAPQKIKDVSVGQEVLCYDRLLGSTRFVELTGIQLNERQPSSRLITVTLEDGTVMEMTPDHPVPVSTEVGSLMQVHAAAKLQAGLHSLTCLKAVELNVRDVQDGTNTGNKSVVSLHVQQANRFSILMSHPSNLSAGSGSPMVAVGAANTAVQRLRTRRTFLDGDLESEDSLNKARLQKSSSWHCLSEIPVPPPTVVEDYCCARARHGGKCKICSFWAKNKQGLRAPCAYGANCNFCHHESEKTLPGLELQQSLPSRPGAIPL